MALEARTERDMFERWCGGVKTYKPRLDSNIYKILLLQGESFFTIHTAYKYLYLHEIFNVWIATVCPDTYTHS